MKGAVCKSCFKEIEDREPWHYRYNARAGLLEPVHDKRVTTQYTEPFGSARF